MEFRLTITVDAYGGLEGSGERVLEGFLEAHSEVGPVVSQNLESGMLSVTFSLPAEDLDQAFELGRRVFTEGMAASGFEPVPVVAASVATVAADDRIADYELQPA